MNPEQVTGDYLASLAAIHNWQLLKRTEQFWVFVHPDRPGLVVTIPRTIYPLVPETRLGLMAVLGLVDADL